MTALVPTSRLETMEAACERISRGELVKDVAQDLGTTAKTLRQWAGEDPALGAMYARAREEQAHAIAEEALQIADEQADTSEAVSRNRLRVDTRKWMASKLAPKTYSERVQQEAVDISQHPDARRFLAAVHQAITENVAPAVADRIQQRIEELVSAPFGAAA